MCLHLRDWGPVCGTRTHRRSSRCVEEGAIRDKQVLGADDAEPVAEGVDGGDAMELDVVGVTQVMRSVEVVHVHYNQQQRFRC